MATQNPFYDAGDQALLAAVKKQDVGKTKALLANGESPNEYNLLGQTPLLVVADLGNLELATILLHSGALVDFRPPIGLGMTPLMQAARRGDTAMIRLLLENGADVNANSFATPLCMAILSGKPDAVVAILSVGPDISAEIAAGDWIHETAVSFARRSNNPHIRQLLLGGPKAL